MLTGKEVDVGKVVCVCVSRYLGGTWALISRDLSMKTMVVDLLISLLMCTHDTCT